MADFFRDQPKLRLAIGLGLTLVMWALYVVRVIAGVGPMHDHQGNQSPAFHYLVGALFVTGMVAVWLVVRALTTRRRQA